MASRTGALAIGPAAALVYIGSHVGQEAVDRVLREATRAVWHRRAAKSPSRCELTDRSAVAATASSAGAHPVKGLLRRGFWTFRVISFVGLMLFWVILAGMFGWFARDTSPALAHHGGL